MAEIHVPKDAKTILDEIIILAEVVRINYDYLHGYPDFVEHEDVTISNELFDKFKSRLNTLGHLWCGMDVDRFQSSIIEYSSQTSLISFLDKAERTLDNRIEFCVPYEIQLILKLVEDYKHFDDRRSFVSMARQLLIALEEKAVTRSDEVADSAELVRPEGANQVDGNTLGKPRLTNAGRTIVCSKGTFNFTKQQSIVIKIMWDKRLNSQEFYPEQEILEKAELSTSSFANLFKSRKVSFDAIFERHQTEKDLWRLNLG